jgi:hypothetical protein
VLLVEVVRVEECHWVLQGNKNARVVVIVPRRRTNRADNILSMFSVVRSVFQQQQQQ